MGGKGGHWSISRKVGYKAIGDKKADTLKVGDIIRNNKFFLFSLGPLCPCVCYNTCNVECPIFVVAIGGITRNRVVLSRSFLFEDEYVDSIEVYEDNQWTRKVGWKLEPVRKKHCAVAIRYLTNCF